jgi:nucleoside-diphosphate-sugar epimerase
MSVVQAAIRGVDSVVHLAALLHILNPSPAMRDMYERINVGGTSTVVSASFQAGVRRVVFFSTIAVYGASNGIIINEETPPNPDSFYAQSKLAAERIVLEAKSADGKQIGTVLRLGAVYGSMIKGNYLQLLKTLAKGRFIPIGRGQNRRTLVYDKDVANAAMLALAHPSAAGKIFNVSDGKLHSINDIISIICQALGREAPRLSLPVRLVRFAAGIIEDMAQIVGLQSSITRATIDKYTEEIAVDSQRIQRELGFVPQYDLATGWKETVMEMRRSGEL